MHADEQRCVAALLQEVDVLRPVILDDVFAPAIELVRNEGVEVPLPSGPVAVHHDDLGRSARARASYRCVDLLRVERTTLVVRALLLDAVRLLPLDDSGNTLHVADDEDLHDTVTAAGALHGKLIQRSVRRQTKSQCTTLCDFS